MGHTVLSAVFAALFLLSPLDGEALLLPELHLVEEATLEGRNQLIALHLIV